jgi:hypothetical protein
LFAALAKRENKKIVFVSGQQMPPTALAKIFYLQGYPYLIIKSPLIG